MSMIWCNRICKKTQQLTESSLTAGVDGINVQGESWLSEKYVVVVVTEAPPFVPQVMNVFIN